jgi:hypothetical protein
VSTAAAFRALVACIAGLATGASAGTRSALGCPGATSRPFLPWLDPFSYTLAPGGGFEGQASAWKLTGGSKLVSGNEPFKVSAKADSMSLSIPAGGSATSPAFCVGLGYPTVRLFATGGNLTSLLKIEVVYKTVLGTVTQPVGVVLPRSSWGPTLPQLLVANATGLLSLDGLTSSVQVRFTALGTAGWKIDDVYVDPWKTT